MTTKSKSADYIEYQQGSCKLRLQNGQMELTLSAKTAFNEKERNKIENDLKSVFEIVTLADKKIVKNTVPAHEADVEI